MKNIIAACLLAGIVGSASAQRITHLTDSLPVVKDKDKVQVLFVGSAHFGQQAYFKDLPKADLFSAQRQAEVAEVNRLLAKYKPDMILIETTPEEQSTVDSLYGLYRQDKLVLKDLEYGRAERYQIGYKLAKQLNHERIYGVDYYESVSNRMLTTGDGIDAYLNGLTQFNKVVGVADKGYKEGKLSLKAFLQFMNHPKVLNYTYQLIYLTPAQVRNAAFTNPPVEYVDTAYVNKAYIGAEFISVFYERELKIYSNIITTQKAYKGKRLLVVMGQRHAAALPKIFANDPAYKVVPLEKYLK